MDNSFKKNAVYLLLYFTLTLLICFLVEVFYFIWGAIQNYKSNQMIFATVWILIVFTILFFILKKAGIDPKAFGVHFIFFGPFFVGGLMLSLSVGLLKTNVINRSYVGTSVTTEEDNANGDGTDTYYHNTYVFHKKDKSLTHEINKLDEEFSEGSSKEEFIFWQTALAKGFEPKNIRGYNCWWHKSW